MSGVNYPCSEIKVIKGWESVLARPAMYMGKKSIFGLQCLMMGIQLADGAVCGPRPDKFFEMNGDDWWEFEKWVSEKTKMRNGGTRSQDKALSLSDNDDEKAFDLWASWFKEYKAQQTS